MHALARRNSDVPGQRRVWGQLVSLLFCLRSLTWTLAKHQINNAFAIKPFIPSPTDSATAISFLHLCGCFMGNSGSVGLLPTAWGHFIIAFKASSLYAAVFCMNIKSMSYMAYWDKSEGILKTWAEFCTQLARNKWFCMIGLKNYLNLIF